MSEPKDRSVWMYRAGDDTSVESRLFPSPDAVPQDEGWVDSPAKVQEPAPAPAGDEPSEGESEEKPKPNKRRKPEEPS